MMAHLSPWSRNPPPEFPCHAEHVAAAAMHSLGVRKPEMSHKMSWDMLTAVGDSCSGGLSAESSWVVDGDLVGGGVAVL